MPQTIALRLGLLGGGTPVSRSGIRWLRRNGQMCRPGDLIGICNVALRGPDGGSGENPHFLGEQDDVRVVLVSRIAGRLRHAQRVSLGGWIDEQSYYFRWQADQVIGNPIDLEPGKTAPGVRLKIGTYDLKISARGTGGYAPVRTEKLEVKEQQWRFDLACPQ